MTNLSDLNSFLRLRTELFSACRRLNIPFDVDVRDRTACIWGIDRSGLLYYAENEFESPVFMVCSLNNPTSTTHWIERSGDFTFVRGVDIEKGNTIPVLLILRSTHELTSGALENLIQDYMETHD